MALKKSDYENFIHFCKYQIINVIFFQIKKQNKLFCLIIVNLNFLKKKSSNTHYAHFPF